jgi:hypothetical protein
VLPVVRATRYVTPLREGGSLPGLMEADDLGTYVVKYTGAGQGRKALIAEVIAAGLAAAVDLAVPRLVLVDVDPVLAKAEPDEEVQELLRASGGLNLGVDFLPGALDVTAAADAIDAELASAVLWFDAFIANVDRSWRNPNLLLWHRRLHLIDHGAALTFHHTWPTAGDAAAKAYDAGDHVLLTHATQLPAVAGPMAARLTDEAIATAVADVPDEWLRDEAGFADADAVRAAYRRVLAARRNAKPTWLAGVLSAVAEGPRPRGQRPSRRPGWLA